MRAAGDEVYLDHAFFTVRAEQAIVEHGLLRAAAGLVHDEGLVLLL